MKRTTASSSFQAAADARVPSSYAATAMPAPRSWLVDPRTTVTIDRKHERPRPRVITP